MQRDVRRNEMDWVFCWPTSTGEVRPGARDTTMNGRPVRYQPGRDKAGSGLRTIVRGRAHACARAPRGFRLDEQGGISRMGCFVRGEATKASLVPARDEAELEVLQEAARAAVLSGDASEWALAEIGGGGGVRWALHVGAAAAVVAAIAARVAAPWTLRVGENEIVGVDRGGRARWRMAGDSVFVEAAEAEAVAPVVRGFLVRPERTPEDGPEYEAMVDAMTEELCDWLEGK